MRIKPFSKAYFPLMRREEVSVIGKDSDDAAGPDISRKQFSAYFVKTEIVG
jgi:hypothetical protein